MSTTSSRFSRSRLWSVEETKAKLKAAAVQEFAEHGLAGTSAEHIARRAGVNNERIYSYFGSKDQLS